MDNCVPSDPYSDAPRLRGNPIARLVREVFPQVCQECGIRVLPEEYRKDAKDALAGSFKKWHQEDSLEFKFIEDMIWEFGRHQEWARKSRGPAWRVFLGRKTDLISLVASHNQRVGVSGVRDNRAAWLAEDPREAHRHDPGWWLDETRRPVLR